MDIEATIVHGLLPRDTFVLRCAYMCVLLLCTKYRVLIANGTRSASSPCPADALYSRAPFFMTDYLIIFVTLVIDKQE